MRGAGAACRAGWGGAAGRGAAGGMGIGEAGAAGAAWGGSQISLLESSSTCFVSSLTRRPRSTAAACWACCCGGLGRLLGLALELGQANAQVCKLVREAQALRLDGQGAVLRDLLGLALEAVQDLAEEGGQHVLRGARLGERPGRRGAGEEGGGGVALPGSDLALLEQPGTGELGARDAPEAVADDRAQRSALDAPGDRLSAQARQFRSLCDRVRPQLVVPGGVILPNPA